MAFVDGQVASYTLIVVVMLILEILSANRERRRKEKGRVEWQCSRCMMDDLIERNHPPRGGFFGSECGLTNKPKETKTRTEPKPAIIGELPVSIGELRFTIEDVVFDSVE